jgi:transposase
MNRKGFTNRAKQLILFLLAGGIMAYSEDLRIRLIRAVEKGGSARSQGQVFEVSASTAVKWMQAFRREGRPAPKPHGGGRRSPLDAHEAWLSTRIEETPDVRLLELCAELSERGIAVGKSSVSRFFQRIGYSFKKKRAGQRTGKARRRGGAKNVESGAARSRSAKIGLYR